MVPATSCLIQSLALQMLLSRRGISSAVRMGVAKSAATGFVAHAWIETDGQVLLNTGGEIAGYALLGSFWSGAKLTTRPDGARKG
jgi:hypothetical protein